MNLPEWRSVVGDDDQLGLSLSEGLQSLLVAQLELAGLHDEGEPRVDGLHCLLDLLLGNHFGGFESKLIRKRKLKIRLRLNAPEAGEKKAAYRKA